MTLITSQEEQNEYVLMAKLDNAKNLTDLLKAIYFCDQAVCYANAMGLKFSVEDSKCVQANAFIQAELFQSYNLEEESATFKINLTILLECLNIFGTGMAAFGSPTLKLCYKGYGSPLILLLEEGGMITDCYIKTMEPDIGLDLNFVNEDVENKIIIESEILKEIFGELDSSSELVEFLMSPNEPFFQVKTFGNFGNISINLGSDCELIELFKCSKTSSAKFRQTFLKYAVKPLNISQKVCLRTDSRNFLSLQYMVKVDEHVCFLEYFLVPEEDAD